MKVKLHDFQGLRVLLLRADGGLFIVWVCMRVCCLIVCRLSVYFVRMHDMV